MQFVSTLLILVGLIALQAFAQVQCRFNATAPETVSYYTCTELAEKYRITIQQFLVLNPLLDPDCSSIQEGKQYCVAGNVVPTTTDGFCKPESYVTCLGYPGGQCCNSKTRKCGQARYVI